MGYFYSEKFCTLCKSSVLDFYKKRILKLYPMHIVTFFLMFILYKLVHFPIPNPIPNLLLVQSYIPYSKIFSFNAVSWFISTIIFMYLLTPILLRGIFSFSIKKLLVTLIGVYFIANFISQQFSGIVPFSFNWWFIYISPYMRFFDYFLGMILGVIFLRMGNKLKWGKGKGTALELFSLIVLYLTVNGTFLQLLGLHNNLVFIYDLYSVPASLFLMFIFASQNGLLAKLLDNKVCCYLGNLSFSFFMLHQVMIVYFSNLYTTGIYGWSNSSVNIMAKIFLYIIIIVLADGLNRFFKYALMNISNSRMMKTVQSRGFLKK